MKLVKWIIGLVAALFLMFLLITFFLPRSYSVERSILIEAPAPLIYSQVADLEAWQEWNPWGGMDPHMTVSYGETTSGKGASYKWNSEVTGDGLMKILEAVPYSLVRYELGFEGWEDLPSYSSIMIAPIPDSNTTEVHWSFEGSSGDRFFARWMSVLMDKFVGSNYDEGLQALKERCESAD